MSKFKEYIKFHWFGIVVMYLVVTISSGFSIDNILLATVIGVPLYITITLLIEKLREKI